MESDLLPSIRGNVQSLRNMWTEKLQQQNSLNPIHSSRQTYSHTPSKILSEAGFKHWKCNDESIIDNESEFLIDTEVLPNFKPTLPVINNTIEYSPFPSPPPLDTFQSQTELSMTMQENMANILDIDSKTDLINHVKNNGIRYWHLARHVFRSGLVFSPTRRSSDSVVPILVKTRAVQHRSRSESLDSMQIQTPFQTLIDYLTLTDNDDKTNVLHRKQIIKRTISNTSSCIERNKLIDTIAQYEAIVRHLDDYEKFTATYPMSSSAAASLNQNNPINKHKDMRRQMEEFIQQNIPAKSSKHCSKTQSLTRNVGRTFTEFIMNDLLSTQTLKQGNTHSYSTTASQTEPCTAITIEEVNELPEENEPAVESNSEQQVTETPNSEVNHAVVSYPIVQKEEEEEPAKPVEIPLMKLLFEGKKTTFTPNDYNMQPNRIPEELTAHFEIAKQKCFFPTETILYASRMIKLDRRGYKERIRILCLTTERLYVITTKRSPYPKEGVLLKDVLGISCTPCLDGFVCVHTAETRDDRGDWIFLIEHPCEFITYFFMATKRADNNDKFLKIELKFGHTRRSPATATELCPIVVRPAEKLRLAYENYETLVIYTP